MKNIITATRLIVAAFLLSPVASPAAIVTLAATDAGFVTEVGGSAKGDGTVTPGAKYNYSVGFELHYGSGALGAPLAPMLRKNYFVFDLTGVTETITSAKLKLWTGTLETADVPGELFAIHETTDPSAGLGLATALAGGTSTTEFDSPTDPLVMAADTLYTKLADGPLLLAMFGITPALDDSFIEIEFTSGGLGYLNTFLGGKVILGGLVPSVVGPAPPQQPFGFTGPDIPGGDPKTPGLILTTVPEPSSALLCSVTAFLCLARNRRTR